MSYEETIEGIAASGRGDIEHCMGLGTPLSIADGATGSFTPTSQVDFQPERFEFTCTDAGKGGVTITTFQIAGENQLGSADEAALAAYDPEIPFFPIKYDRWTSGSTLTVTFKNESGSTVTISGNVYGEIQE